MKRIKIFAKQLFMVIFYLPGTFLHELAHYAGALVTLSPVHNFTIIPKFGKNGSIVFGSVSAAPKFQVFLVLISLAPMFWVYILYRFLEYYKIIEISFGDLMNSSFHMNWDEKPFALFIIYVAMQLLFASRPSSQDLKVFWRGLISTSGFITVVVLVASLSLLYLPE